MRDVASQVQIMIYRRSSSPIKDWQEIVVDINLRAAEIMKDTGRSSEKRLLELAAYAVFAAVSERQEKK